MRRAVAVWPACCATSRGAQLFWRWCILHGTVMMGLEGTEEANPRRKEVARRRYRRRWT